MSTRAIMANDPAFRPPPKNSSIIENLPTPKTIHQIQSIPITKATTINTTKKKLI